MDFLTRVALKRPVSTVLALIALIVFGSSSIFTFEMELEPSMSMPMIGVFTNYEGADAETVEKLVSRPIEEIGARMQGMASSNSTTSIGSSRIIFMFDYSTDIDKVFMNFQEEIEQLALPEGCGRPKIMRATSENPFIYLQVRSESGGDVLNYVNNTVKQRLERVSGVAEVKIYGGNEEYIRVTLDERLMEQYSVTIDSVKQALAATDYTIPADTMRQGSMDIRLASTSSVTSIAELETVPIKTNNGAVITLRDIAEVSYSVRKSNSLSRHNGTEDINIELTKNQNTSTVTAANRVIDEIERLRAERSDIVIDVTMNSADSIVASLKDVGMTLIIGILLSMLTLFLFFGDVKASLLVGSSMPISLMATLILMALSGLELDIMTLGGLVISIGMMVDSSIVVLESCFRAQERGLDFKESALEGTKEVTASIVASTITTIVVYAPIALVGSIVSQYFGGLCVTIIYAMISSLIVSLTFIPLFFMYYKPVEKKKAPAVLIMEKISARYAKAVRKIIPKKFTVLAIALALFAIAVMMLMNMNMELDAEVDKGEFQVTVASRKGTAMEVADQNAAKYEKILIDDPDIKDVSYNVTGNEATISAFILKESGKTTSAKVEEYNKLWSDEKSVDLSIKSVAGSTSGSKTEASVTLTGNDYAKLKQSIYAAMNKLSDIEGVFKVSSELQEGAPEGKIKIDPKKAMAHGLTPQSVATLVANVNTGVQAIKIKSSGNEYNVRLEYPEGRYDDLYKLMSLRLTSSDGSVLTLGDIATLEYDEAPGSIMKRNGLYSLSINLSTSEEDKFRVQDEANEIVAHMERGGAEIGTDMETEILNDVIERFVIAIAAAIFLVFLVMAMQFESPRFSAMVMMSIPFSLIGAIGLYFISGQTLTSNALLGILMLVGIVVNDGILFVDTANRLRADFSINEALARSGELRLRPILMTTFTTILSMVPLVLSQDSGADIMEGMGLIIIGGLTASTFLILFLLPTFYTLFMGKRARLQDKNKS